MRLTVMSLNLHDGAQGQAWAGLAEQVVKVAPDVLALQECVGWDADDHRRLRAAEQDLGMRGRLGPQGQTRFRTGLLVNPATVEVARWEDRYAFMTLQGHTEAHLRVPGLNELVVMLSVHLTPFSATAAAIEVQALANRADRQRLADPDGLAIVAGDWNYGAPGDAEPDWDQVRRADRAARAMKVGGRWRANPAVDEVIEAAGLVDTAAHLAAQRGDRSLLAPTGRHGGVRTDRILVSGPLKNALADAWQVTTAPHSDHDAVVAVLDL